jgi:hypothetical protein
MSHPFVQKTKKKLLPFWNGGIRRREINSFHALAIYYSIIEGETKQREAQFKKKHREAE